MARRGLQIVSFLVAGLMAAILPRRGRAWQVFAAAIVDEQKAVLPRRGHHGHPPR